MRGRRGLADDSRTFGLMPWANNEGVVEMSRVGDKWVSRGKKTQEFCSGYTEVERLLNLSVKKLTVQ